MAASSMAMFKCIKVSASGQILVVCIVSNTYQQLFKRRQVKNRIHGARFVAGRFGTYGKAGCKKQTTDSCFYVCRGNTCY